MNAKKISTFRYPNAVSRLLEVASSNPSGLLVLSSGNMYGVWIVNWLRGRIACGSVRRYRRREWKVRMEGPHDHEPSRRMAWIGFLPLLLIISSYYRVTSDWIKSTKNELEKWGEESFFVHCTFSQKLYYGGWGKIETDCEDVQTHFGSNCLKTPQNAPISPWLTVVGWIRIR